MLVVVGGRWGGCVEKERRGKNEKKSGGGALGSGKIGEARWGCLFRFVL